MLHQLLYRQHLILHHILALVDMGEFLLRALSLYSICANWPVKKDTELQKSRLAEHPLLWKSLLAEPIQRQANMIDYLLLDLISHHYEKHSVEASQSWTVVKN